MDNRTSSTLEKNGSGLRSFIAGVGLLLGGFVILVILTSNGTPAFLAFLGTCWMFLGGVIAAASGVGQWVRSRSEGSENKDSTGAVARMRDSKKIGKR